MASPYSNIPHPCLLHSTLPVIFHYSCLRNTGIKYKIYKPLFYNNLPSLGCQNFISTHTRKFKLTIHANHFKLSVGRNPRARVSKDVITSATLKHNRQTFFCFQLIQCGNIRLLERIYRHFFDRTDQRKWLVLHVKQLRLIVATF